MLLPLAMYLILYYINFPHTHVLCVALYIELLPYSLKQQGA
jgi:hypothetical protein